MIFSTGACYRTEQSGRFVKTALLPELPASERQRTVILCGDIHRSPLSDSFCKAQRLMCLRCPEEWEQVLSLCRRLSASLVVARQAFLEQLLGSEIAELTNFGRGSCIVAILNSDTVDVASATKLLRLGCRGVLQRPFSSKVLAKAVLAILQGELWAPRAVVAELLSDLLRENSAKVERGLTPQEARILELASQGLKNSAIGEALFISPATVRWHKRRLNRKLRTSPRIVPAKATSPAQETAAS
jgi:DNA-binding NarL/FixJ family response regulator